MFMQTIEIVKGEKEVFQRTRKADGPGAEKMFRL